MEVIRVLFLVMHRVNRSPSQRFRFEQYLPYLSKNGFECTVSNLANSDQDKFLYRPGNYLRKAWLLIQFWKKRRQDIRRLAHFDLVFVQREAFLTGSTFFESRVAKSGTSMIFDFDDSIWLQDDGGANKKLQWLKNPKKTQTIISLSSIVLAGNNYLADYAHQFSTNVEIIPTTIDTELYVPGVRNNGQITIGWSGSVSTIKHFETSIPALKAIKSQFPEVRLVVIGDAQYYNTDLDITGVDWKADTEVDDLNQFDIGIMPLPDDDWSRGKCGLKGLQYMALEIPTIMSPVGVNTEIIRDGVNGYLASTEEEWIAKLTLLINDPALRKRLGKAGRQTVIEKYSVEANKHKYLEVFQKAAKARSRE